jgi:hypothetical protein
MPGLRERLESERGGPIHPEGLEASGRAFPVGTFYGLTPEELPGYLRRSMGRHWLIPLFAPESAEPELAVYVAARATDVTLDDAGDPVLPLFGSGEEYLRFAVPTSGECLVLSPEWATALTVEATGRRVALVPEMMERPSTRSTEHFNPQSPASVGAFVPECAHWRVTLDAPVRVRGTATGRASEVVELYIGPRCAAGPGGMAPEIRVPVAAQPTAAAVRYQVWESPGDPWAGPRATILVPLVGPVWFERAEMEG